MQGVLLSEFVEVPDTIKQRRNELAFDCGKFDFVIHEGKAVLLDANKTPGPIPLSDPHAARSIAVLADGLEALIRQKLLSV